MMTSFLSMFVFIAPMRWAASYVEAQENSYLRCFVMSFVDMLIRLTLLICMQGNAGAALLLSVAITAILCIKFLKVPKTSVIAFTIMWIFFFVISHVFLQMLLTGLGY